MMQFVPETSMSAYPPQSPYHQPYPHTVPHTPLPASAEQEPAAAVERRIQNQIEFYFSPENLSRDAYLVSILMQNGGQVPIAVIAHFPKIREMHARIHPPPPSESANAYEEHLYETVRRACRDSPTVRVSDHPGDFLIPHSWGPEMTTTTATGNASSSSGSPIPSGSGPQAASPAQQQPLGNKQTTQEYWKPVTPDHPVSTTSVYASSSSPTSLETTAATSQATAVSSSAGSVPASSQTPGIPPSGGEITAHSSDSQTASQGAYDMQANHHNKRALHLSDVPTDVTRDQIWQAFSTQTIQPWSLEPVPSATSTANAWHVYFGSAQEAVAVLQGLTPSDSSESEKSKQEATKSEDSVIGVLLFNTRISVSLVYTVEAQHEPVPTTMQMPTGDASAWYYSQQQVPYGYQQPHPQHHASVPAYVPSAPAATMPPQHFEGVAHHYYYSTYPAYYASPYPHEEMLHYHQAPVAFSYMPPPSHHSRSSSVSSSVSGPVETMQHHYPQPMQQQPFAQQQHQYYHQQHQTMYPPLDAYSMAPNVAMGAMQPQQGIVAMPPSEPTPTSRSGTPGIPYSNAHGSVATNPVYVNQQPPTSDAVVSATEGYETKQPPRGHQSHPGQADTASWKQQQHHSAGKQSWEEQQQNHPVPAQHQRHGNYPNQSGMRSSGGSRYHHQQPYQHQAGPGGTGNYQPRYNKRFQNGKNRNYFQQLQQQTQQAPPAQQQSFGSGPRRSNSRTGFHDPSLNQETRVGDGDSEKAQQGFHGTGNQRQYRGRRGSDKALENGGGSNSTATETTFNCASSDQSSVTTTTPEDAPSSRGGAQSVTSKGNGKKNHHHQRNQSPSGTSTDSTTNLSQQNKKPHWQRKNHQRNSKFHRKKEGNHQEGQNKEGEGGNSRAPGSLAEEQILSDEHFPKLGGNTTAAKSFESGKGNNPVAPPGGKGTNKVAPSARPARTGYAQALLMAPKQPDKRKVQHEAAPAQQGTSGSNDGMTETTRTMQNLNVTEVNTAPDGGAL